MNAYKKRNFDGHLDSYRVDNVPDISFEPDSNQMHDRNRAVTHFYLPQEDGTSRIISDVEIAFSPDPSVASHFSYEHRERLAHRVVASHQSNGMTDDVLADTVACNSSFERSEVSRLGDEMFKSISSIEKEGSDEPVPQSDPEPVPDVPQDPNSD